MRNMTVYMNYLVDMAGNPETSVNNLTYLANDFTRDLLQEVAQNLKTPIHVLNNLAHHDSYWVRLGVARNPQTPLEKLAHLSVEDGEVLVRRAAQQTIKVYKND